MYQRGKFMGKFREWNRQWCLHFLEMHPLDKQDINRVYEKTVASYLEPDMLIYDVGGGKHCRYRKSIDKETMMIYALDISDEELAANTGLDGKIVTDVCKKIPIPYGQVDMITSSSVCEHLKNPFDYYENASKALKKDGVFINLFPCRYAIFAMINRILPKKFAKNLLYFFLPGAKKDCGFPAYYEDLYYKKIIDDYHKAGFKIEKIYLRYLQADYYTFFIPLFLINYAWDACMKKFRCKNFCTHMMIVARKKQ